MVNIATQVVESAMPELRARYATRLRTQTSELLDFISRCERGRLTEEICSEARILAHSLCGTGSTFGFPEISDTARYLETAIDCGPPHNAKTYIELTLNLIRACDPAIKTVAVSQYDPEQSPASAGSDAAVSAPEGCELPLLLAVNGDPSTEAILNQLFDSRMQVVGTSDPQEALDLLRFSNPAVVIFDMQGPECGASLERLYVQAQSQHISVIALVPSRQAAAVAHAISAGGIQCIPKPVSVEALYHSARATIERGRLVALVADDDVIVREMMTGRFKSVGFSTIGANDGAQVLDLAARHLPSIIVLDRIMPGIEGVAVLQMLKANPVTHEIPVIMLTSKRKANEITEARRAGAADYIVKPFKPDHVVFRCMLELGMMPGPAGNLAQAGARRRPPMGRA